jgi:hypothetical protein
MSDHNDYRTRTTYPFGTGQQPNQQRQPGTPTPQAPPQPMPTVPSPQAPTIQPPGANEPPPTVTNPYYLAGYLQRYIGRVVRVEFTVGTGGTLSDRVGFLQEIGASYIVLRQFPSNDIFIGDLYSVKFVNVYANTPMA